MPSFFVVLRPTEDPQDVYLYEVTGNHLSDNVDAPRVFDLNLTETIDQLKAHDSEWNMTQVFDLLIGRGWEIDAIPISVDRLY